MVGMNTQGSSRCPECGEAMVCPRCSGLDKKVRELMNENTTLKKRLGRVSGNAAKIQSQARTGSATEDGYSRQDTFLDELERRFPGDRVVRIKRGQYGADALLYVRCDRAETRPILVEVKNTLEWGRDWTAKLTEHMRPPGAVIGVIVSEALPPGISSFGQLSDDVFVISFDRAMDLIHVLRRLAIVVHRGEVAAIRQSTSAEGAALDYLTGKFGDRIHQVLETGMGMMDDLAGEKRALTRMLQQHWKKRETRLMQLLGVPEEIAEDLIAAEIPLPAALQTELPGEDGSVEILTLGEGGSGEIRDLPNPLVASFDGSSIIPDGGEVFVVEVPDMPGIGAVPPTRRPANQGHRANQARPLDS